MNEAEIVARARELFSDRIGDDAAVVGEQVITTDLLVEDVDFTRAIPLQFVARKSLAVNLSDLAAMGATPSHAVVALGLPEWVNVEAFLVALADAAKEHAIEIVGGDLSRAEKFTIAITAIGRAERPLLRSGAKPGDRIYLSRPIGGSATGLFLLQNGWPLDGERATSYAQRELAVSAMRRNVDPEPEIALGIALAKVKEVTACIDVSDGLSTDLHHLCDASNCGAEIERERIPIFSDLLSEGPKLGVRVQDVVLHGGEEFALLFTSSLRESELSARLGRPVYAIGRMTRDRAVMLREDGVPRVLEARGFDHFV
ncbi:MAG TPA: thiamine-phosphate kinase [Thermoanaerobaculia bacterium]|nr:thiamine-phosphate kinase [Thermoanaerobaculia bacterium]